MKHLKLFLPLIFGAMFLFSCSKDLDTAPEINVLIEENEYTIPIEDALSSLEDFLMETGTVVTKGSINDFIDNYFTVSAPSTKSSGVEENLLYAVNLKGEGGFAILAADSRVRDDIIAVTESGSITSGDFEEPTPERIPTDNDDLSISEYDAMIEAGYLADKTLPLGLICKEYARQERLDYNPSEYNRDSDGGVVVHPWKTVKEVPKMMNTFWHQSDPFNKYCPTVGLFCKKKAPAGCVCIALAQIIAYHEYPANLICKEMPIDYALMKKLIYYDGQHLIMDSDFDTYEMVARFSITVGRFCNTKYHYIFGKSFGFALPADAKTCLEMFGYKNVSLDWGYVESRVLNALDNGCPVFMSGTTRWGTGHAWVVDGYMKRSRFSRTGEVLESKTLVHCNWGWSGDNNGYFTSGVFHTGKAEMYDLNWEQPRSDNYKCLINTIIYDNPLFNESGNFSK